MMAPSGPSFRSSSLQAELLEALRVFHSDESLHFVASDTSFSKLRGALQDAGWQVLFKALVCACNEMLIFRATAILGYLPGWSHLHVPQVDLTGVVPEHPQRLEMLRPAHFHWGNHESMHMTEAVEWLNQHVCPTGQCVFRQHSCHVYSCLNTPSTFGTMFSCVTI